MARSTKVTEFLKECIADAILSLLKEKSIEKITVDEIARVSGAGRATYFRYFKRKEEAITYKLIKLWERWAEENQVNPKKTVTLGNARSLFAFNYSIRETLTLIYCRDLQFTLYDAIKTIMHPEEGTHVQEYYTAAFYSYGLFGLLDEWIARGFAESVSDMENCFCNLSSRLLK